MLECKIWRIWCVWIVLYTDVSPAHRFTALNRPHDAEVTPLLFGERSGRNISLSVSNQQLKNNNNTSTRSPLSSLLLLSPNDPLIDWLTDRPTRTPAPPFTQKHAEAPGFAPFIQTPPCSLLLPVLLPLLLPPLLLLLYLLTSPSHTHPPAPPLLRPEL